MASVLKPAPKKNTSTPSVKKKAAKKKEIKIKYSDKSPGQPQLVPIFEALKKLIIPYAKGTMKLLGGSEGKVVLISIKPVEVLGRKREELWFASALVQKGYVGFYYMPVYSDPGIKKLIKPELLKCLKGKACFHIKKPDKEIFSQVKEALKIGYDCWHERGWL
ncbi:MAG TPA: hypothetical protein VK588_16310 [Chitinophagaceae bacterium]|nr:hypothetical protein [Chitinophagaceae bacterium]